MNCLFKNTIEKINESNLSISEIAKGADVGDRWLRKVSLGEISNPGVVGVQKVYDFLCADDVDGSGMSKVA